MPPILSGLQFVHYTIGHLPLLSCIWVSPSSIIAAGHDCTPLVFAVNGSGQVTFVSKLEQDKKASDGGGGEGGQAKFSAKALFQAKDRTGQSEVADTVLNTTHQNQARLGF